MSLVAIPVGEGAFYERIEQNALLERRLPVENQSIVDREADPAIEEEDFEPNAEEAVSLDETDRSSSEESLNQAQESVRSFNSPSADRWRRSARAEVSSEPRKKKVFLSTRYRPNSSLHSDEVEGLVYRRTGDQRFLRAEQRAAIFRKLSKESNINPDLIYVMGEDGGIITADQTEENLTFEQKEAIKKQFLEALTLFYGATIMNMVVPQEVAQELLEKEDPLSLVQANDILQRADSIAAAERFYRDHYPIVSQELSEALEEAKKAHEAASFDALVYEGLGSPGHHLMNAIWYGSTTGVSIMGAVSLLGLCVTFHHGVPIVVGLSSLAVSMYADPINFHRATAGWYIYDTASRTREAVTQWSLSAKALAVMQKSRQNAEVKSQEFLRALKEQQPQVAQLSKQLSPELIEAIDQEANSSFIVRLKKGIEELMKILQEQKEAFKQMIQLQEKQRERIELRVRFPRGI